jgi:hypothetical protein
MLEAALLVTSLGVTLLIVITAALEIAVRLRPDASADEEGP